MKILTIVGARPQFIKAAPFSDVFRREHQEVLVHTGQHYDKHMSEVFFHELGIPSPDYNLNVGSGNHGWQTAKMLMGIEEIVQKEGPDGVLVYGDTNSTLAGALAASKLHVPVYHVEAGLRSYNKWMPEEQNRVLTDHVSTLLLCPTQTAVTNLEREGITSGVIFTGDIMYDAVLRNIEFAVRQFSDGSWRDQVEAIRGDTSFLDEKDYYLATIHRAENTDSLDKIRSILDNFAELEKAVLMPIHPRTWNLVKKLNSIPENVVIVKPVSYLLMLYLTANAHMVITDSGGLQKEAYFLRTPCTTLRDQTEWIETLADQWNVLSPIEPVAFLEIVNRKRDFMTCAQAPLFGEGHAAELICKAIVNGG